MSKLTVSEFTGTIKSDEEMLSLWRQVEVDIAEVGQSYNSPGGVEVTFADIDKVREQIKYWENRVMAKKGYNGRNYADIAPYENSNNETL